MKHFFAFLFIAFFSLGIVKAEDFEIYNSQTGIVQNVKYVDLKDSVIEMKQIADIKLIDGKLKGKIIQLDNILTGSPYYDINLKKGMKVVLHVEGDSENPTYAIQDIKRSSVLIWLSFLFCSLLIYVGKKKGISSLISIILTCILIFYLLTPLIQFGINPISATFLICLVSTATTMYLVGGFNRKSTSATVGCTLSLIFAGIIAYITTKFAYLTGFTNEHSLFLYSIHPELNFSSIAISTIILATLGAVMDVGMSIASTINEIYLTDNTKTVKELFRSGMNVGRDIIGTMANTLILVYLGTSLPLLLLASNIDFQKFINLNQVVTEISSALIGSCAIIICVPITAFIASELIKKTPSNVDLKNLED